MFMLGVPLLILAFAIYNIVAFLLPGTSWSEALLRFHMMSGGEWSLSAGDLMVAGSILILLIELVKSARIARRTIIDHILSMVLFVGMLVEFLMVPQAASATFFLLLIISFVDVAGGFAISIRAAQRDVSFTGVENVPHG
jgi:hypothetical protein